MLQRNRIRLTDGGVRARSPVTAPLIRRTHHQSVVRPDAQTTGRIRIAHGSWFIEVAAPVQTGEQPTLALQFHRSAADSEVAQGDSPRGAAEADYGTLVATLGFRVADVGHIELSVWETGEPESGSGLRTTDCGFPAQEA